MAIKPTLQREKIMLVSNITRKKARSIAVTLNVIAGRKVVKQSPVKVTNGWEISRVNGRLSLPINLTPIIARPLSKRLKRKVYIVGIGKDLIGYRSAKPVNTKIIAHMKNNTIAQAFHNAMQEQ